MIRLELPYDIRLVRGTAFWLSCIAEKYGVSAERATALCFVIETTLAKRVLDPCGEEPIFTITLENRSETVSVSITDKGLPYVLTGRLREALQSGLVNSFSFEQLAIDGQRLRFDVEKEPQAESENPLPEAAEETLLDKEISCRATGTDDEDILRAIRVIYSNYGFHYVHQEIYNHDHFRAALLSGKYVSILAENAHKQTLGHVALSEQEWFPGIPEVCNLVVAEFARGVKASKLLVDAALEASASKQFEGIFALPVVRHPISQKLFNGHGFTPCGLFVRTAVCVSILNKNKMHSLYLPAECEDFVCNVFKSEGAMYEVLPEGDSPRPETELSYCLNMIYDRLEVRIDNVGKDFAGSLAAREVPKDVDMTDSVQIYLNMNDPGCPLAYRYYRERGCIFAGCLPGGSDADYLLMLHVKGAPITTDNMVLEPNYQEMIERLLEIAG